MYVCMILLMVLCIMGNWNSVMDVLCIRTCVVAMPLQAESKCVYTVHMTLSHLGLVSDRRTCMYALLCVMHAHTLYIPQVCVVRH